MKRHARSPRGGPLCGSVNCREYNLADDADVDCGLCRKLLGAAARKAAKAGPVDHYQGLSRAARDCVGGHQGSLWRLCECPRGSVEVSDWYMGRAVPSWEQARRVLTEPYAAHLTPEDFGYVRLPDGRVARLLVTTEAAP